MSAKMNPEAKTKIVEALRSGKYTQGEGALQEGGCFCVWGVVCDISGKAAWDTSIHNDDLKTYDGCWLAPSTPVVEWVGGTDHDSFHVTIDGVDNNLMGHNDDGKTFEQLANAIEEQL